VHVPFCAEMCLFCGCNVVVTRSTDRVEAYLARLEREFERVRETGIGRRAVHQYHWGGGTPTHLSLPQIERLQAAFDLTFETSEGAEVAIEVDPRVTTVEQIELLTALGFNRVSLGVQDFDLAVQEAVKRVQPEAETRAVIDAARACGIHSVNVDLIYGLPHQTRAGFADTVRRLLAIREDDLEGQHAGRLQGSREGQPAQAEVTVGLQGDGADDQ
jgi:oxygen-independent coproporphyrinogen-3 oxidase